MAVYVQKYRLHQANGPGWYFHHDTIEEAQAHYEELLTTRDADMLVDGTRWYGTPDVTFEILPVLVCDPE